jgi:glycosyltransferase involved in cell wall biosynthesis
MFETSVIIPTYNRLAFLKEAVASVQQQSYQNFELIVVDDGSTDGTLGNSVKYIYQPNAGPAAARNRGLREARGDFITFLDSDDLWRKDKLQTQIDFMKSHPQAMVCYTDETWIRRGVRVNQGQRHKKFSGWIFEKRLPLCIVSPSSALMRRQFFEIVGRFDESLPACEDYDLWLRAALKFPVHFIAEELLIKRGGHSDQLSSQWGLDRYRVQALLKLLNNDGLLAGDRRAAALTHLKSKCRILEQGCRRRGKKGEADLYRALMEKL